MNKMLVTGFVLGLLYTSSAWPGFDEGIEAYKSGDYLKALKEIEPLAVKGDPLAEHYLAFSYKHGLGVSKDEDEAVKWYKRAANQGLAKAQYDLANMYYEGLGTYPDTKQAIAWYREAAEQGHVSAQYNLGMLYVRGEGLLPDLGAAVKWWRKAASQGDYDSQLLLANVFADERSEYGSNIEAKLYFKLVSEKKFERIRQAFSEMGITDVTIEWLREEAQKPNSQALFYLALMHYLGNGAPKDDMLALSYSYVARGFYGGEDAFDWSKVLKKLVTPEQVAAAEELAMKCINSKIKVCE